MGWPVDATSSEVRLLELVDLTLFRGQFQRQAWVGSAAELERLLNDDQGKFRDEARRLLKWENACGSYLGRLEKCRDGHQSGRVTSRLMHGLREWRIQPPERDQEHVGVVPVATPGQAPCLSPDVRTSPGLS
jgi:hypothetical protein